MLYPGSVVPLAMFVYLSTCVFVILYFCLFVFLCFCIFVYLYFVCRKFVPASLAVVQERLQGVDIFDCRPQSRHLEERWLSFWMQKISERLNVSNILILESVKYVDNWMCKISECLNVLNMWTFDSLNCLKIKMSENLNLTNIWIFECIKYLIMLNIWMCQIYKKGF